MNKIWKMALVNALGTTAYIIAVTSFMNFAQQVKFEEINKVIAPVVFLLLLVLSASVTGSLVFGKPVLLYIDGKKKEAFSLLVHTLGILFAIIVGAIILLVTLGSR